MGKFAKYPFSRLSTHPRPAVLGLPLVDTEEAGAMYKLSTNMKPPAYRVRDDQHEASFGPGDFLLNECAESGRTTIRV
jgi:hypothetical protein